MWLRCACAGLGLHKQCDHRLGDTAALQSRPCNRLPRDRVCTVGMCPGAHQLFTGLDTNLGALHESTVERHDATWEMQLAAKKFLLVAAGFGGLAAAVFAGTGLVTTCPVTVC